MYKITHGRLYPLLICMPFILWMLSFTVYAGPIFLITPNTTQVTLGTNNSAAITYTVTNESSEPISQISIDPTYRSPDNSASISIQNNNCNSLAPTASCTFQVNIAGNNQTSAFQITPRVCGYNNAICSMPLPNAILNVNIVIANEVNLTAFFNQDGIFNATMICQSTNTGGVDSIGNAYDDALIGTSVIFNGIPMSIGTSGSLNAINSTGQTITLPAIQASQLNMLATGVHGVQALQGFTVNYTDGSSTTFTQSLSDWAIPSLTALPGETKVLTMSYYMNCFCNQIPCFSSPTVEMEHAIYTVTPLTLITQKPCKVSLYQIITML